MNQIRQNSEVAIECVQDEDKIVLELSISLQDHTDYDFDRAFQYCLIGVRMHY